MASARSDRESEPQVALNQIIAEREEIKECWNIAWVVENLGQYPMRILGVRLPHSQFKSEERRFEPAMDLKAGESAQFRTFVRCDEPTGLVTENAFVIFYVDWLGEPYRIFVRLRVVMNSQGKPETATESITTQKVGFSGTLS
jgi:hypothetical protein